MFRNSMSKKKERAWTGRTNVRTVSTKKPGKEREREMEAVYAISSQATDYMFRCR